MITAILLVVAASLFVWAHHVRSTNHDMFAGDGQTIAGFALSLCGAIALLFIVVAHIQFHADMAEFQQVRKSVEMLQCRSSHDVLMAATTANGTIRTNQYFNHRWLTAEFVPNGWDTVTTITIPECR